MNKTQIIEDIHQLVSHNVIGDIQLMNRYKGFRGELFLNELFKTKEDRELYEGGIIISTNESGASSLDDAVYINIVDKKVYNDNYIEIFRLLSTLEFKSMYLIVYNTNQLINTDVMIYDDETIAFNVPEMIVNLYDLETNSFSEVNDGIVTLTNEYENQPIRKKNSYPIKEDSKNWLVNELSTFDENELYQLFMSRLILDGYIGFSKVKGKPSDIDLITKKNGQYSLIEVKEKDVPKKAKKGFGLDVPRIQDFDRISKATGLPYYLIVREIDNQTNRNLLGWKYINITDFIEDIKNEAEVEGGTGMRSTYSSNPTLICSYEKFQDIN